MDFLDLVKKARSCRRFDESKPLSMNDLEWLADCARFAPSARNAQVLRFILVSQGSVCEQVFAETHWAGALKDWPGPGKGERPTGFIALLKPQDAGENVDYSLGIAACAMQLGAATRGWGACMLGQFDRGRVAEILRVEPALKPGLLMAFGVEAEKRVLEPLEPGAPFAYWRDDAGVHHVPKRALAELVVGKFQ